MNFKLFSFWWLINAAFRHCANIPMERNITGSTISISYENYSTVPPDLSRFRKKQNDRYTTSVFMSRILLRISKLLTNSLLRYAICISDQLFFYKFIHSDTRSPKCRHIFSHDYNSELYVSGFIWSGSRSSRNI